MRPGPRDMIGLGPWQLGANNLALETDVPRRSFRRGVNVDVTDAGKIIRRAGRERVFELGEPSNLFGYGDRGFYALGQSLYAFTVDRGVETPPVELYTGLRPDARLGHCLIEPDIFVSDGEVSLRIAPDNTVSLWTIPTPETPTVTTGVGGSLDAGRYLFAIAFRAPSGEESPLSPLATVDAVAGSTISLTTQTLPGYRVSIYMTKPNGAELLHLATFPGGTVNVMRQQLGRSAPTVGADPMPAGEFAAVWNGRLLTALDRFVCWSEPLQYGLTQLMYNYVELVEPVTMLAAVDTAAGFFVGQQTRTYFCAAPDPTDTSLKEVYPAGVVPGTMQMVPGARLPLDPPPSEIVPVWLATNGIFVAGLPDGSVAPLTENRYAAMRAGEGAAMYLPRDGINQYVATIRDPSPNNFALSDAFTAEVRPARRGT